MPYKLCDLFLLYLLKRVGFLFLVTNIVENNMNVICHHFLGK